MTEHIQKNMKAKFLSLLHLPLKSTETLAKGSSLWQMVLNIFHVCKKKKKKVILLFSEELPLRNSFSIYPWVPLILWKVHAGVSGIWVWQTGQLSSVLCRLFNTDLSHNRPEWEEFMPFYSLSSLSAASGVSFVTVLV